MNNFKDEYAEASPARPCPICAKPDWCAIRKDGKVVLCQRIESDRRYGDAGWRHDLTGCSILPPFDVIPAASLPASYIRMVAEHSQHILQQEGMLEPAVEVLGLDGQALLDVGIGWSRTKRAWMFPMWDASGEIIGLRYRTLEGKKFSFKGGRNGIFRSVTPPDEPIVVIVEGATDCAAGLQLGLNTLGRPGCNIGNRILQEMDLPPEEIIILGDNDTPGRKGAATLQKDIGGYTVVPRYHKDLRELVVEEGTSWPIRDQLFRAAFHREETKLFQPL